MWKVTHDMVMYFIRLQSLPQTVISKWVVAAINPDEEKRVTFSEYVHFLSSYIMLAKRDLIKFVFGHMDTGARCYLT